MRGVVFSFLILSSLLFNVYGLELITTVQVAQASGGYECYQKNNIYPYINFANYPELLFSNYYAGFPTIHERVFSGGMADFTLSQQEPFYSQYVSFFGTASPRVYDFCSPNGVELYKVECGNYWENIIPSAPASIVGLLKLGVDEVVSNPENWRCEEYLSLANGSVVKQPGFFAPLVNEVSYAVPGNPGPVIGAGMTNCYIPNCVFNVSAKPQQGRRIDRIIMQGPAPSSDVVSVFSGCGGVNEICSSLFTLSFYSYLGPFNNTYFFTAVDDFNISGAVSVSA